MDSPVAAALLVLVPLMASVAQAQPRQPGAAVALVQAELAQLDAASAADLVAGAPARGLIAGDERALPYGAGIVVTVSLAPGAPTWLSVPTELGLSYRLEPSGGALRVTSRPSRADLRAAVHLALSTEQAALEAALRTMDASGITPPAGASSWRSVLRIARLDPRLPRERSPGDPSWHFIFEPFRPDRGGYPAVLLDAHTRRILVPPSP